MALSALTRTRRLMLVGIVCMIYLISPYNSHTVDARKTKAERQVVIKISSGPG